MKIFGSKSLSHYLFYLSRAAAFGSIILVSYILLSLVFGNFEIINEQFQIGIPFLPETYIKGFYETSIITSISIILIYMCVFFYSISLILKSFKSNILFSKNAIKYLNLFAIINLVVFPLLYLILHFFVLKKPSHTSAHNLFLSFVLGVFILFISAIFKRGLKVQNENDLTI